MSSSELAQLNTDLAIDRTLMAADRSLMAWVRTALSMISFGFTIYKVLDSIREQGAAVTTANVPRDMGLFLTGLGTVAMLMGVLEYWYRIKKLREVKSFRIIQPSFVMALVMAVTGLCIFVGISFKVL
ncbi:MAG: DUF202 domain-containing protein [Variovorax sp.]|nr:MAG: DUF202 domain-containing protein [Variovorax sp.]